MTILIFPRWREHNRFASAAGADTTADTTAGRGGGAVNIVHRASMKLGPRCSTGCSGLQILPYLLYIFIDMVYFPDIHRYLDVCYIDSTIKNYMDYQQTN